MIAALMIALGLATAMISVVIMMIGIDRKEMILEEALVLLVLFLLWCLALGWIKALAARSKNKKKMMREKNERL